MKHICSKCRKVMARPAYLYGVAIWQHQHCAKAGASLKASRKRWGQSFTMDSQKPIHVPEYQLLRDRS